MKRYVVVRHYDDDVRPDEAYGVFDLDVARRYSKICDGSANYTIYELGPEVKEPDFTKLVEWVQQAEHDGACGRQRIECDCFCGRDDALKAAGIS